MGGNFALSLLLLFLCCCSSQLKAQTNTETTSTTSTTSTISTTSTTSTTSVTSMTGQETTQSVATSSSPVDATLAPTTSKESVDVNGTTAAPPEKGSSDEVSSTASNDGSNDATSTPTTTTSTTTVTTTTTTPAPSEPEPPTEFNHTAYMLGPHCTCDLTTAACDPNCCCDPDCDRDDRRAFTFCRRITPDRPDPRYCFHTDFIYGNNSQLAVRRVSPSLFCLDTDNLKEHAEFLDREPVENATEFEQLRTRHRRFLWPESRRARDTSSVTSPFVNTSYYAGNPIWTYREQYESLGLLTLPGAFNSQECNAKNPLRYMEDGSKSECRRSLKTVSDCSTQESLDAATFTRGFFVVKDPGLFRNRSNGGAEDNPFIFVSTHLCKSSPTENDVRTCLQVTEDQTVPSPTPSCRNVLRDLRYEIHHNGVKGVDSIVALVELQDLEDGQDEFVQSFSYAHFWSTDNVTDLAPRSGNPGYLHGKPLVSGLLTAPSKGGSAWTVGQSSPQKGVSIMPLVRHGDCFQQESERQPILFGKNIRIGCSFAVHRHQLSNDCQQLKAKALNLLIGPGGLARLRQTRVASFGNSDPREPGDWTPVLITNPPLADEPDSSGDGGGSTNQKAAGGSAGRDGTCPNMVLRLHIEVAYAHVGSVANPQAKVLGVQYRFEPPEDVAFRCSGLACHDGLKAPGAAARQEVEVVASDGFVDLTQPALDHYAEFPVIEAKFPHDFFYPFVVDDWSEDSEEKKAAGSSDGSGGGTAATAVYVSIFHCILTVSFLILDVRCFV